MLRQLLNEVENANGALDLDSLSRKLGASRPMLEIMLDTLARQGRLKEKAYDPAAACNACGQGCATTAGCNLRPVSSRVYFLNPDKKGKSHE